jgi:hypothetical protein
MSCFEVSDGVVRLETWAKPVEQQYEVIKFLSALVMLEQSAGEMEIYSCTQIACELNFREFTSTVALYRVQSIVTPLYQRFKVISCSRLLRYFREGVVVYIPNLYYIRVILKCFYKFNQTHPPLTRLVA